MRGASACWLRLGDRRRAVGLLLFAPLLTGTLSGASDARTAFVATQHAQIVAVHAAAPVAVGGNVVAAILDSATGSTMAVPTPRHVGVLVSVLMPCGAMCLSPVDPRHSAARGAASNRVGGVGLCGAYVQMVRVVAAGHVAGVADVRGPTRQQVKTTEKVHRQPVNVHGFPLVADDAITARVVGPGPKPAPIRADNALRQEPLLDVRSWFSSHYCKVTQNCEEECQ